MRDLVPHQTCPLCTSRAYSTLATQQRLAFESNFREQLFRRLLPNTPRSMLDDITVFADSYPARLVVCEECGLVSRDPRLAPAAEVAVYAQDDYGANWLEDSFRRYYEAFKQRMPELEDKIGKQASVVEVGSYVGGFLAAAGEAGWQALGIDVGRQVTEFSRRKGLNVRTGTLQAARLPDSAFDAAFIWDCFDQLPEPGATLQEIRRILKADGWLFIQVPNGEFVRLMETASAKLLIQPLQQQLLKALAFAGVAGFPYQTGHTRKTLQRMLATNGFGRIRIRNRVNILKGAAQAPLSAPEQVRYLRLMSAAAEVVYHASLRSVVIAPWMEAEATNGH